MLDAAASRALPPLQIPLSDRVLDTLTRLQDIPLVFRIVTGCVVLCIALTYLDHQFKLLDSLLDTWQSIRAKLDRPAEATEAEDLRAKLLKACKIKTEKRLEDILNCDQLIALSWENQPDAVGRYQSPPVVPDPAAPAERTFANTLKSLNPKRWFRRGGQAPIALAPTERMIDVFWRVGVAGRLLILGEPGAGKTTTLLELARELIAAAPVPIIFELSAWTEDRQAIDPWLVAQLQETYNLPPKVGQAWVANHRILPLLDGLDELGLERQKKCIAKLNDFLPLGEPDRQAVVCCRTQEFHRGEAKLTALNGAVELQPLTEPQIRDYLTAMGRPSLWAQIDASAELRELAQPP